MLCHICNQKEAAVHLTQIVGNKLQKADLCVDCARQQEVNDPAGHSLADMLLDMGAQRKNVKASGTQYHFDPAKLAKFRPNIFDRPPGL